MREISIIIPSCNFPLLQSCVSSIIKYTDFREVDAEFIIVANGLPEEAKPWLNNLSPYFTHIWLDEKSGVCKSTNMGAALSQSPIIAKMDDDIEILPWAVNPNWIKCLLTPFSDKNVGLVAPIVFDYSGGEISMGNCVVGCLMATRSEIWKTTGGFDELFDPGMGEDTDYSFKVTSLGYKIVLPSDTIVDEWNEEAHSYSGSFPMYHKSALSYNNVHNLRAEKNYAILKNRWGNTVTPQL